MENPNFSTVIVRDSRIQDISNKLEVVINKGSASNTYQEFAANSETQSNVNFNIALPSESVILDREVLWESDIILKISVPLGAVPRGASALYYGVTDSLNQFPLNSLINTATATINNASISINTSDIMYVLLRTIDDELLSKYNTPHMSDKRLRNYSQMSLTESNPLGSFLTTKGQSIPRGAHPIKYMSVARTVPDSPVLNRGFNSKEHTSNAVASALVCPGNFDASFEIVMTFHVSEPLLFLSPFLFGENSNNAGLFGVNNMNLTFNIDSTAKRVWSSGTVNANQYKINLEKIENNKLKFNFLTTQPSDDIKNLNVLPHVDYQRFKTNVASILPEGIGNITSNAIQLSQIPNKIYIVCRKTVNDRTMADSNSFMAITKCNITFNNLSGILSGAGPNELYQLSRKNGSKQDLYEFLGKVSTGGVIGNGIVDDPAPATAAENAAATIVYASNRSTCGSILILSATDLHLPDYLSNGSTGQFSFQFQLDVKNLDATAYSPELLVIVENNGLFMTQSGYTTTMSSLMTKDIVLDSTKTQAGESQKYINKQNGSQAASIKNIPLLRKGETKSSNTGTGVKSGGNAFYGGAYSGGAFNGTNYY